LNRRLLTSEERRGWRRFYPVVPRWGLAAERHVQERGTLGLRGGGLAGAGPGSHDSLLTAMLPPGPLGTRADILMDVVVISLVLILPALALSYTWARSKQFTRHRNLMTTLGISLGIVVAVFEADMQMSGGIFEMTKDSVFAGTTLMNASIWGHTALAITTSLMWAWLIIMSWRRFPRPPKPAEFSARHRFWGQLGLAGMTLTGLTGVELYVIGFVY